MMHIYINIIQYILDHCSCFTCTMEFTQFADLESLRQTIISQNMMVNYNDNLLIRQPPPQFSSILQQIQQINHSRSISCSLMDYQLPAQKPNFLIDQPYFSTSIDNFDQLNQQMLFTPSKITIYPSRRSTIFTTATHSKDDKSTIYTSTYSHQNNSTIQVFYFGQRTYKHIQFNKYTTIQMLINKAIQAYIQDYSLDQTNIHSNQPKNYQMRFVKQEGSWLPDYAVEPIARNRVIADTLFQVLVLVKIGKDNSKSVNNCKQMHNNNSNIIGHFNSENNSEEQVKLNIFNQANMHVTSLILYKNQTLQKAIEYLQAQLKQNIVLFQTLQTDMCLPVDMDIRNLGTFKLYVKKKRYLDQPQKQRTPLKIISTIPKDLTSTILPPIGITQASRYEEFEVIKINSRGIQQPRVIGFDQTKYYNYETSVRKKNKQVSFLSVFVGNNILTGTKKPQRLISDIVAVNPLTGLTFEIVLPQKSILFKVDSDIKKQKILRKLKFLIDYNKKKKK